MKACPAIDYDALDPGIRDTVRILRAEGFDTMDSGDGVSKTAEGGWDMDAIIPVPHVAIRVSPSDVAAEADRLVSICAGLFGRRVVPTETRQGADEVEIHASYDPASGVALLVLIGAIA